VADKENITHAEGLSPEPKRKSLRTIYLPNSSPIPNWFLDSVVASSDVPSATIRVFLFMLRQTVGWDNSTKELSLTTIQNGSGVTRHTAIHAVRVLTDCWGCFTKQRGWKLQHSSIYKIGILSEQEFEDRFWLCDTIYGTPHPTPAQLREKPCTPELLAVQEAAEDEKYEKSEAKYQRRTRDYSA
jgi:hypothetical protein